MYAEERRADYARLAETLVAEEARVVLEEEKVVKFRQYVAKIEMDAKEQRDLVVGELNVRQSVVANGTNGRHTFDYRPVL